MGIAHGMSVRCPRWECRLGIMQTRVGPVALRCLKIVAAVSRVGGRPKMERVTSAAGGTRFHLHLGGIPAYGATFVTGEDRAQIPPAGGTRLHLHLGGRQDFDGGHVVIGEDRAQISR